MRAFDSITLVKFNVPQDKIMKIFYVWAFCRDQSILDPRAAWRVIDMSSQPTEQWV